MTDPIGYVVVDHPLPRPARRAYAAHRAVVAARVAVIAAGITDPAAHEALSRLLDVTASHAATHAPEKAPTLVRALPALPRDPVASPAGTGPSPGVAFAAALEARAREVLSGG